MLHASSLVDIYVNKNNISYTTNVWRITHIILHRNL